MSNKANDGISVTDIGKSDDPRPYSQNNKVVGFIIQPATKMDHYDSLMLILDEYVSMCEGEEISSTYLILGNSHNCPQKICLS